MKRAVFALLCLLFTLSSTACGAEGGEKELLFFYQDTLYCSDGRGSPVEILPEAFVGTVGSVVPAGEEPAKHTEANFGEIGAVIALCGVDRDELYVQIGTEWVRFLPQE